MRVFCIDPSFATLTGHHFAVNTVIAEECRRRGLPCTVLGRKINNFESATRSSGPVPPSQQAINDQFQAMNVQQVFTSTVYIQPNDHELAAAHYCTEFNNSFEHELRDALPESAVQPGDVFVMHTTSFVHLVGLYRWYRDLQVPQVSLRVLLRYPAYTHAEGQRELTELLCGFGLRLFKDLPEDKDVRFFTDWSRLSQYYLELSGIQMDVLPISIDSPSFPKVQRPSPAAERPLRFGFIGNGRADKGFSLLPEAIQTYRAARIAAGHPDDEFLVQATDGGPEIIQQLEQIPGVQLLHDFVVGADYQQRIQQCDVVLVCYDPVAYHLRSSHILVEALGLGCAVITTQGTWMSDEIRSHLGFPVGTLVEQFNAPSLADAMVRFAANADYFLANAAFASNAVRLKHNSIAFMDFLLDTPWPESVTGVRRAAG